MGPEFARPVFSGDVESIGNAVFVADSGNYRLMIWDAIPSAGSHGPAADRLIGQPTFTSRVTNWEGVSDRTLKLWLFNGTEASMKPAVIDSAGTVPLWAPDPGNARVLRYDLSP